MRKNKWERESLDTPVNKLYVSSNRTKGKNMYPIQETMNLSAIISEAHNNQNKTAKVFRWLTTSTWCSTVFFTSVPHFVGVFYMADMFILETSWVDLRCWTSWRGHCNLITVHVVHALNKPTKRRTNQMLLYTLTVNESCSVVFEHQKTVDCGTACCSPLLSCSDVMLCDWVIV